MIEWAHLACAVLQLHQQQTHTGDAPADVTTLLVSIGLSESELASSEVSSEVAEFKDIISEDSDSLAGASDRADGCLMSVQSVVVHGAAPLLDGLTPIDNEAPMVLGSRVVHFIFP